MEEVIKFIIGKIVLEDSSADMKIHIEIFKRKLKEKISLNARNNNS